MDTGVDAEALYFSAVSWKALVSPQMEPSRDIPHEARDDTPTP